MRFASLRLRALLLRPSKAMLGSQAGLLRATEFVARFMDPPPLPENNVRCDRDVARQRVV